MFVSLRNCCNLFPASSFLLLWLLTLLTFLKSRLFLRLRGFSSSWSWYSSLLTFIFKFVALVEWINLFKALLIFWSSFFPPPLLFFSNLLNYSRHLFFSLVSLSCTNWIIFSQAISMYSIFNTFLLLNMALYYDLQVFLSSSTMLCKATEVV